MSYQKTSLFEKLYHESDALATQQCKLKRKENTAMFIPLISIN